MHKRKAKNDNLTKYREKLASKNEALVKRAIAHIVALSGEIGFSAVSRVTYDLADIHKNEKGLTTAGITTSSVYRALVEEAQASQNINKGSKTGSVAKYSPGDMQMALHALRVENAELKRDNKILKLTREKPTKNEDVVVPIKEAIIEQSDALYDIAKSMVNRLCELEITYLDTNTNSLKLAMYEEIIVGEDALNVFYKKELDEIQNRMG